MALRMETKTTTTTVTIPQGVETKTGTEARSNKHDDLVKSSASNFTQMQAGPTLFIQLTRYTRGGIKVVPAQTIISPTRSLAAFTVHRSFHVPCTPLGTVFVELGG